MTETIRYQDSRSQSWRLGIVRQRFDGGYVRVLDGFGSLVMLFQRQGTYYTIL
jgi:hypothetical protein